MRAALVAGSVLAAVVAAAAGGATASAQDAPEPYLRDLAFPTNMASAPDGRLFFTEKDTGRVRVVTPGGDLLPTPFAAYDVTNAGETGMLGIALDPDFPEQPWVYLYLSEAASGRNVLLRVRADGNVAGREERLLTLLPASSGYHNGGDLAFGADGMLYVAVGEAHDPARAQDPSDPGGAILRVAPDGSVPPDNPFGGDSLAYTIGNRNSFGLCVDPATGDVWETENGPDRDDEVNLLRPGANLGWPEATGDSGGRFADPVAVFHETEALTGCAVWRGRLWFGAAKTGRLYRMTLDPAGAEPVVAASFDAGVIDVTVSPSDDLFVATSDAIWRIEAGPDATASATPSVPGETPPADPTPTAPAAETTDGDEGGDGWIVWVAAAALAAALAVRLVAGRRLGAGRHDEAP
ncbi:MAG TPA: PQQ-dependent sugar dehydrogenase [Actinomycetota bacterium]